MPAVYNFRRLFSILMVAGAITAAAGVDIPYTLAQDGRISIAVYDGDGCMVRTLRSGEPQNAGARSVHWDGLDFNGRAVPAGDYHWKLLNSQGMKAEYLLSLGTSVGIEHWVGQHGGPNTVAVAGGSFFVGGHPEGSPLMVKAELNGGFQLAIAEPHGEPANGTSKIAVDGEMLHVLMASSRLWRFNAGDGRIKRSGTALMLPVRTLAAIKSTQGSETIQIEVTTEGRYTLRVKAGQADAASSALSIQVQNQNWYCPALAAGKFQEANIPRTYDNDRPVESKNRKLTVTFKGDGDKSWAIPSLELMTPAEFIDGRFGELVASFPALRTVAWLDPETGGILKIVPVTAATDREGKALVLPGAGLGVDGLPMRANDGNIALIAPGEALIILGNAVYQVSREGNSAPTMDNLSAPKALAFDPPTGGCWLADGPGSDQIKFFDAEHRLKKTVGRLGGRAEGSYKPEDFSGVTDIAADGTGGFVVVEPNSAPRRTAHFDGDGKLLREWYGGQQFYTFAAPDPENPDQVWMDSQWGWVMQCQVDWTQRSWHVLACYKWGGDAPAELVNRYKMASPHAARRLDLDNDGRTETYLVSDLGLQLVDEAAGKLRPISMLAMASANHAWEWDKLPLDNQPKPWLDAIAMLGETPAKAFRIFRAFAWADANGDFAFQPEEFRLARDAQPEGKGGFFLTKDLAVIKNSGWGGVSQNGGANWQRYPLQGFTASHAPIWDWTKVEPGKVSTPETTQALLEGDNGEMYQLGHGGANDDGYTGLDTYSMGHGFGWPANMSSANTVIKWDAQGRMLWKVGALASRQENAPGELHHPVHFAGAVNGTIGVCDKVVQPVVFWTEDGLHAGQLFDRRADDGLPMRVYRWWKGITDDFDPEVGRALLQYDMILGGTLIPRANGEAIYIGAGWNNCPAFKVTGWNEFRRQEGSLNLPGPAIAATGTGTGLPGKYFANRDFAGTPEEPPAGTMIWFEPKRSAKKNKTTWNWPDIAAAKGEFSARWEGTVEAPFSEDFVFAIYKGSARAARLWIGGRLLIETTTKENKAYAEPLPLTAGGSYAIAVEWSGPPDGELHLCWQSRSQPVTHIPLTALAAKSDTPQPVLSVSPPAPQQIRPATITWVLSRQGPLDRPLTIDLQWDGSAQPGADVGDLPPQVTFPAGQSQVVLTVTSPAASRAGQPTVDLVMVPSVSPDYRLDGSRGATRCFLQSPLAKRIENVQARLTYTAAIDPNSIKPQLNENKLSLMLDRSGLEMTDGAALSSTSVNDAWVCQYTRCDFVSLFFDFGKPLHLTDLHIWNFNTTSAHGRGWGDGDTVREATEQIQIAIAASPDGPWTELGTINLKTPVGKIGDPGERFLVHGDGRYLRFSFPRGQKGSFGLSEVEFFGIE